MPEGENYITLSLLPIVVHRICEKLDEYLAAVVDDEMHVQMHNLLCNIIEDFES